MADAPDPELIQLGDVVKRWVEKAPESERIERIVDAFSVVVGLSLAMLQQNGLSRSDILGFMRNALLRAERAGLN